MSQTQLPREDNKLRIIIVEDDEALRNVLMTILTRFGHDVRSAGDGASLDRALADYPADVILLDLNLPGEDGVAIARRLRQSSSCGIIMTTGRGKLPERLDGFQSGADLYFVKPIDPMELHAALLNLARRLVPAPLSAGPAWLFTPQHSCLRTPSGITVTLTHKECIVMRLLLAVPGETVCRSSLFAALGYQDDEYSRKRLDTLLSRLRSKVLARDPESELPLRARHGTGYAFLADLQE